jgi:hypothetical protein
MPTITIQDETFNRTQPAWKLKIQEDVSSLREIIRSRVYQSVSEYNARQRRDLLGLVLSDPQISEPIPLDWEEQYQQALQDFSKRRFIVLVNGCQIIDLDKSLHLSEATAIWFFLLAPLASRPFCCWIKLTD